MFNKRIFKHCVEIELVGIGSRLFQSWRAEGCDGFLRLAKDAAEHLNKIGKIHEVTEDAVAYFMEGIYMFAQTVTIMGYEARIYDKPIECPTTFPVDQYWTINAEDYDLL